MDWAYSWANMNQQVYVYINILYDQVLLFSQHPHDEYAIDTLVFQDDNRLKEYVTGFMNAPYYTLIALQYHLIEPHRKSVGHVGTVGKMLKSASLQPGGFRAAVARSAEYQTSDQKVAGSILDAG